MTDTPSTSQPNPQQHTVTVPNTPEGPLNTALPRDPAPRITRHGYPVTITEGYVQSKDQYGTLLHFKHSTIGNPVANIVIVHGSNEHSGRYEWMTTHFLNQGYNVFRIDHRGHGKSVTPYVNNYIARGFIDDFHNLVDDLDLIVQQAYDTNASIPMFMLGHSMGALATQFYGIKYPGRIHAFLTTGGGAPFNLTGKKDGTFDELVPEHIDTFQQSMPQTFSEKFPIEKLTTWHLNWLDKKLQNPDGYRIVSPESFTRPLPAGKDTPYNQITSVPEINQDYDHDPLRHTGRTLGMDLQMAIVAMIYNSINAPLFTAPTLIFHGDKDEIVPEWLSHDWFNAIGSTDKQLEIWHDTQHGVFDEYCRYDAITLAINWFNSHL